jgi:hypothetical protein
MKQKFKEFVKKQTKANVLKVLALFSIGKKCLAYTKKSAQSTVLRDINTSKNTFQITT